jgi:hypothetical protein
VSLDTLDIAAPAHSIDLTPDLSIVVPVDPTTVSDIHTYWVAIVNSIAGDAANGLAADLTSQANDSVAEAAEGFDFDNIVSDLNNDYCDTLPPLAVDRVCAKKRARELTMPSSAG